MLESTSQIHRFNDLTLSRSGTWLVTGVAGFIGSNLLEALLKLNQKVVGLDNFSTEYRHNLEQVKVQFGKPGRRIDYRCQKQTQRMQIPLGKTYWRRIFHSLSNSFFRIYSRKLTGKEDMSFWIRSFRRLPQMPKQAGALSINWSKSG